MSLILLKPLPIRFHCYKVLPLVYDESLSYYEQLCKILYSLNETIEAVTDIQTAISDIGGNVTELTEKVNSMVSEIDDFEKNVNNTLNIINETIENYDVRFNNLEAELTKEIQNNVKALKDYIDTTLGNIEANISEIIERELQLIYNNMDKLEIELKAEIESEIKKLIDSIPDLTNVNVINPVTGKLSKVQIAFDDLFMNTRYNALTIDEFNHLHLSIDECNKLMYHSVFTGWSIITWLTEAKELFNKSLKHRMANAVTGAWQDFKKSIEENTDMLRICGCLTVAEFGALNMSVDAFNDVGATCYELAWESNRVFI